MYSTKIMSGGAQVIDSGVAFAVFDTIRKKCQKDEVIYRPITIQLNYEAKPLLNIEFTFIHDENENLMGQRKTINGIVVFENNLTHLFKKKEMYDFDKLGTTSHGDGIWITYSLQHIAPSILLCYTLCLEKGGNTNGI
ncbi:hypothetical protein SOV_22370 [Sporomusa ovata DSM 2662]|uniref:Uncharacterized protein n=1 Tax=Sporomusa ovata TaxID=2378 RepID=A0A0U1L3M5_9FIRM|nr:hypothetical protein [Sporomusa ovata]EQB25553.1 hypothetical protein SOV_4c02160 [Sporomusa ovata DSM 2662]CQR74115.1 hypothetical protein SpAn4DRAFT_0577 [Sporomusa ovata]